MLCVEARGGRRSRGRDVENSTGGEQVRSPAPAPLFSVALVEMHFPHSGGGFRVADRHAAPSQQQLVFERASFRVARPVGAHRVGAVAVARVSPQRLRLVALLTPPGNRIGVDALDLAGFWSSLCGRLLLAGSCLLRPCMSCRLASGIPAFFGGLALDQASQRRQRPGKMRLVSASVPYKIVTCCHLPATSSMLHVSEAFSLSQQ